MFIYMIRNKTNDKRYFGLSTKNSLSERYLRGIAHTHNAHLKRSIETYGLQNFEVIERFDTAETLEELNAKEVYYIQKYNTTDALFGYNKNNGGNGIGQHTEEAIQKMREAGKRYVGENNGFFGKGELFTGENNPFYGKTHTEETLKKMRGKRNPMSEQSKKNIGQGQWKKVIVENWKTGEKVIYQSVKEAVQMTGNRNISLHCSGKRNPMWKDFIISHYVELP